MEDEKDKEFMDDGWGVGMGVLLQHGSVLEEDEVEGSCGVL